MSEPLFPTMVVGSYTRPPWLLDAIRGAKAGAVTKDQLDELKTQAKLLTIKELEDAGLDVVSDGEQGRTSFYEYLTEQVSGFTSARSKAFADGTSYDSLRKPVGKVEMRGDPLVVEEAKFLRAHTGRHAKVSTISPNFLANFWEPGGYYQTKESFLEDMIAVSKQEASALSGNVDYIQWDDPGLGLYTEPTLTEAKALELARTGVEAVNRVIAAAALPAGTAKALHMCWGNLKATHQSDGPLMRIYPALLDLKVDVLMIELASARHEDDIEVFREYPSDKRVAAGVIDVKTPDVEPVRIVKKRVERLLKYVEPAKLMLTTDCGFAPVWDSDRIPRSSCFLKLESMTMAARELRAANA